LISQLLCCQADTTTEVICCLQVQPVGLTELRDSS